MLRSLLLAALIGANALAQTAAVEGDVRDGAKQPVADVAVSLRNAAGETAATVTTTKDGHYHFTAVGEGQYAIAAKKSGYRLATASINVKSHDTARVDLVLTSEIALYYFDEPTFTVAGVSDPGSGGGHGSDAILRSTEKLAKATADLDVAPPDSSVARARELREATKRDPKNADAFRELGDVEERLGHPLEAVGAFQRAAELAPTEPNLFAWAADLLKHRAPSPAAEVFTGGCRQFPKSVRMLLGLGAAWYAVGSFDKALQSFIQASDIDPADSNPYLFLARVQGMSGDRQGVAERLERFVRMQPQNALANYYYAQCLWEQKQDAKTASIVVPLLQKAVRLDPKLAPAAFEEGTVFEAANNVSAAIEAFSRAVEADPNLAQAHYRLGQAYKRAGKMDDAQREFALYKEASKRSAEQETRERAQIPEFVFGLRSGDSVSGGRPGAH